MADDAAAPPGPDTGETVTLVQAIRAHKVLVILAGLGLTAVSMAFVWVTSPGAIATGQLGLISPATGNVLLPLPTGDATMARYTAQRALFAKSDAVLEAAATSIPDATPSELRRAVTVTPSRNANAILISASSPTADRSVVMVRGVMDAYRAETAKDVQERSDSSAVGWEARGDDARAEQIRVDGRSFGDGVEFEVSPSLSDTKSRSILSKEVVLGLAIGLGLGALAAWLLEDSRIRRRRAGSPRAS